ncbi:hypothetical protein M0811_01195 [Anaeramoeba ignava]|uniref:Fibronectin type-III domain-containing protein n=1 Tax=Anaeramoeba ignava TaxID=1746090 RepID=A0A9Q0RDB9_ANAIG|nr:hypothetical protein M0811_01195 [Anaeramoeba ignava]
MKILFLLFAFLYFLNFIFCTINLKEKEKEGVIQWNNTILNANDGEANDTFGSSIAISENGEILVIGSPNENQKGKAYIFEKTESSWNQVGELIASDGAELDQFGSSIGIGSNGTIIVIGAYNSSEMTGNVYVFEKNGAVWDQVGQLNASDGESGDRFGKSVAISKDGQTIVVGSPFANSSRGKVYVFDKNETAWNFVTNVSGSANPEFFGSSVAITDSYFFAGVPSAQKVYVFKNDTSWIEEQILEPDVSSNSFGSSLAISAEHLLVVGAPGSVVGANASQGKFYVFERNETTWNQVANLTSSDGEALDNFGFSVSISGNLTVIGNNPTQNGKHVPGKSYVFELNSTEWEEIKILNASDGTNDDLFGYSVAIAQDTVAVGAPCADPSGIQNEGSAYVYEMLIFPSSVTIQNCTSLFSSFQCFWDQVSSSGDIKYEIKYLENWTDILSPIFDSGENVYYQEFNSSVYSNITGNDNYSIEIRACNTTSGFCGGSTNQINLTTRIDSVKNFSGEPTSQTIALSWDYPNVAFNGEIPNLDHYQISYHNGSGILTNKSIPNVNKTDELSGLNSSTNFSISIFACPTTECGENVQGEMNTIWIETLFASVENFSCSVYHGVFVSCSWQPPQLSPISPSYYNFSYQCISQDDSNQFSLNSTSQIFKTKFENLNYSVQVSCCDSESVCGTVSSLEIHTENSVSKGKEIGFSIGIILILFFINFFF